MPRYFVNPFAVNGDREAIPDTTDPNGFVSYDTGWGFDYERDPDPLVDPLTKDIEREKTNSILFDITENIKHFQDFGGAPEWSSVRAAGAGYPRDARVTVAGVIYVSTANANASTPGISATWIQSGQTDPTIISIAALTPIANQFIYFTATDVAATSFISSFGRNLVAAANDAAGRAVLNITGASTASAGLVEWATDAEVNSGATAKAVEARQLRLGFQVVWGSFGGAKGLQLPSWLGGWTINFGRVTLAGGNNSGSSSVDVSLAIPYAGTPLADIEGFASFRTGNNTQDSSLKAEMVSVSLLRITHYSSSSTSRGISYFTISRVV